MVRFNNVEDMAAFVAVIVTKGIAFEAGEDGIGWYVRCTGY